MNGHLIPKCHLWTLEPLTRDDIFRSIEVIRTFEEDSHFSRRLVRCCACGQLYLKEFYEEIDWESGDDPQYVTFIPVRDEANAVEVNTLNSLGLLSVRPSIRVDHPKGMPLTVKRLL